MLRAAGNVNRGPQERQEGETEEDGVKEVSVPQKPVGQAKESGKETRIRQWFGLKQEG